MIFVCVSKRNDEQKKYFVFVEIVNSFSWAFFCAAYSFVHRKRLNSFLIVLNDILIIIWFRGCFFFTLSIFFSISCSNKDELSVTRHILPLLLRLCLFKSHLFDVLSNNWKVIYYATYRRLMGHLTKWTYFWAWLQFCHRLCCYWAPWFDCQRLLFWPYSNWRWWVCMW